MTTSRTSIALSPRDIVNAGLCIGCGSCVAQAGPSVADVRLDTYGHYKPAGSAAWMARRSLPFTRTCPFSPGARNEDQLAAALYPAAAHQDPLIGRFDTAYVGYVAEQDFRAGGSSGGMVSWVASELLRLGLVDSVAHVAPAPDPQQAGQFFGYRFSRTQDELRAGAKSRYYPVELSDVLRTVRSVPGRYAVVGVPCFIKAVRLLQREDPVVRDRVRFTLGLFCGHMKSARLVESFAWQMGVRVDEIARVEYRLKDFNRPASWYTAHLTLRDGRTVQKDWFHLADGDWGAGFFQNEACNFCDDVVAETADISFGDAWLEPYSSDGGGTNVVVVRSPVLRDLVASGIVEGRLHLDAVDEKFVQETQAAGFRQRREGLAYRLTWRRPAHRPRKRVAPDSHSPTLRRKLIYRMRSQITAQSHRVFWLARRTGRPALYIRWAGMALTIYHGLAYSQGKLGAFLERWGLH
ncbi:MAG TPA: Coenzyme F420 hydrogenase/dehydrogenase, beta subunit C-terminal domain [Chloroflexia bacterium]|nr:Coenzyme F420 hydrogenase/dehydrogenase, beta subunit C-terminal domain [Chloroflexia bacterium]